MLNAIMQKTSDLETHFMSIQDRLDEIEAVISVCRPRKQRRLIRKPISGKDFKRIPNVTLFMHKEIAKINARATGNISLLQFPDDVPLKDIQSSALSVVGLVLARYLDTDYGVISYNKLCFKRPALFAKIVRELQHAPELDVYVQASGQWAIKELIKLEIHYRKRSISRTQDKSSDDSDVDG